MKKTLALALLSLALGASAAPSVGYQAATNIAEAVIERDVPSWARQDNPPTNGFVTAQTATNIAEAVSAPIATNAAETVVGNHLYYASTNLADNVELRLFSGEWVNAEYDGVGTADVVLDLTGVPTDKVTDTIMILNCAAAGTLTVATSANSCRVIHKKDANPLELKSGLNLLTFSRYRLSNGTNEVLVTNNELE